MARIYAIAAMSENRVIGHQGKIPWHLPDDFRWFKHKTMGGTLFMGRKTYESIGQPLPGRKTVVFSRSRKEIPGVSVVDSPFELFHSVEKEPVWLCGGAEIYNQLLDTAEYLYLTRVKRTCPGDAFFPEFAYIFTQDQVIHEENDFQVERWRNTKMPVQALPPEPWPQGKGGR